jgi:hypothetical protein
VVILLFDFKLIHIPADKHKGPDGLLRREPTDSEENEDDNPKAWIDHVLSLGIWEATWSHAYLMQQYSTWLLGAEDLGANAKATTTSHNPDDEGIAQLHQYLTTTHPPLAWMTTHKLGSFGMPSGSFWQTDGSGINTTKDAINSIFPHHSATLSSVMPMTI